MEAPVRSIYGQGSTTGRDSGEVIAFNSSKDWLATNKTAKGGDSGGPFFVKENGDAKMVGLMATSLELGNQGPIASPDGSAGNTIDGVLSSNRNPQFDN